MSAETLTLWVCQDCYVAYAEGDYTPTEQATPWALFDLSDGAPTIWSQVTAGRMLGDGDCPHRADDPDDAAAVQDHAEQCEHDTFSSAACQGCGTHLAGDRYAMTRWDVTQDES